MVIVLLQFLFGVVFFLGPLAIAGGILYQLLSLPLRRQERARLFLDLLELGLKEGRSPEQSVISVAQCRDASLGARFHLVAAHLETGLRLDAALGKVPRLVPPQIRAMLQAGEAMGDPLKVLPACRQMLGDGQSQTQSAMNYLMLIALPLAPFAPVIFLMLSVFVFPKLMMILREMEVGPPAFTLYVVDHANALALIFSAVALAVYAALLCHNRIDWLSYRFPWRRKRMQRDFAAMLGILLDAEVPEERAVTLAAETSANGIFKRRAVAVTNDLRAGVKLPAALRHLDDAGEFEWRMTNASRSRKGFRAALGGWLEALDARAFQLQQAAAHLVTTALLLFNGLVVGAVVVGTFQAIIAIVNTGVLW